MNNEDQIYSIVSQSVNEIYDCYDFDLELVLPEQSVIDSIYESIMHGELEDVIFTMQTLFEHGLSGEEAVDRIKYFDEAIDILEATIDLLPSNESNARRLYDFAGRYENMWVGLRRLFGDMKDYLTEIERERLVSEDIVITTYEERYKEQVKDLFVQLQEHLASLDERKVIVLKDNYRDGYFDYVISEVEKHNGKIILLVIGGEVVGIVVCKVFCGGGEAEYTTSCPKIGFISDLVVDKGNRGRGIGKLLISEAEKYFRWHGCNYCQLEVFAPNVQAMKLYKTLGFEENCFYMSKKIEY